MERNKFNKIIDELQKENLSDLEIEALCVTLGIKIKKDIDTNIIESFLRYACTDKKIFERYGSIINEYYKLPEENKKNIYNNVYKCFSKDGHLEIDCVCASIVYEVERFEDKISADRKALVDSIKRNVKRQPERPRIDFRKAKDE